MGEKLLLAIQSRLNRQCKSWCSRNYILKKNPVFRYKSMLSFSGIIFTYQRKSSLFFLIQWWRTSFIKYIIWSFIWKLAEGSVTLWAKYWAIKRQVTREFALLKIQTFKKFREITQKTSFLSSFKIISYKPFLRILYPWYKIQ